MNNYKLIENRPELTSSQVVAGMNFTAVKAGAIAMSAGALGGKAAGAALITKGLVAVLAVTGGLAVYKNYDTYKDDSAYTQVRENETVTQRDKSKGPVLIMETVPVKNHALISELSPEATCQKGHDPENGSGPSSNFNGPYIPLVNIDSLNALEQASATVTKTLTLNPGATCRKEGEAANYDVANMPYDFKPTAGAEAKLWTPGSFCEAPDIKSSPVSIDCNLCDMEYAECTEFDIKGKAGVWLRVSTSGKGIFKVISNFKNISLVKSDPGNRAAHPIGIAFGPPDGKEKGTFLKDNFKAKRMTISYSGHIDLFLIFNEEVKKGDKIIIDDVILAKIE